MPNPIHTRYLGHVQLTEVIRSLHSALSAFLMVINVDLIEPEFKDENMSKSALDCLVFSMAISLAMTVSAAHAADADGEEGITSIQARYTSRILFFKVGEISLSTNVGHGTYSANTHIRAAGLAALFADFDIEAEVAGLSNAGQITPNLYTWIERNSKKTREVTVQFEEGLANSNAAPPFGSMGQPPAMGDELQDVIDPMSAFLQLSSTFSVSSNS